MSYTPTYKRPYEQWKELPSKETLCTAEVLTQYDDTFEKIEEYLESEGKKEYALVTEAGYSIVASIDEYYVLTVVMKNKAGDVLSTSEPIDLPIESMIINVDYDEESGILTFSLQNGQTLDVNISTIVRGLVPTSRKIAGVDLEDDITADELKDALGMYDEGLTAGTLKPWLYDTENEVEIGVYNGKPVYRKYFTIHVTTTNGLYTQAITDLIPDYEEILNHKMYTTSGNLLNAIYANQETLDTRDWMCYFVNVGGNIISISRSTSQPELDNDFSFMAEYTKTTDLEGSGNNLNPYGIYDAKLDDVKSSIASVSDEVDAINSRLAYKDISSSIDVGNSGCTAIGYVENGQVIIRITYPAGTKGEKRLNVDTTYAPRITIQGISNGNANDFGKLTTSWIDPYGDIFLYTSEEPEVEMTAIFTYPLKTS